MAIGRRTLVPNGDGFLSLALRCARPAVRLCSGRVTVKARVSARLLVGKGRSTKPRLRTLGRSEEFEIKVGRSELVLFQLNRGSRRALGRMKRMRAQAVVVFRDAAGTRATQRLTLTLKAPRRART